MLKKRIIPVQLLINNRLVKTVNFDNYRDVGDPVMSSKVYDSQDADELIFLNIDRSLRSIQPLVALIEKVSEVCFMPLSVGGGIRSLDDASLLIKHGADKVIVNSACFTDQHLISRIADKFGSQAVMVSIDVKFNQISQKYKIFSDCGRVPQSVSLEEHIKTSIKRGAGELFVNSIDKDGTMSGYDIRLIQEVMKFSLVPVIACGGAGSFTDIRDVFLKTGVDAVACGSIFNFGDNNPIRAKAFLKNYNIPLKKLH
jgi:cyclase